MTDGKLGRPLQESLLTLIAVDAEKGAIAVNLIDTELFEPPYDDIANRIIAYRKRWKRPPGESHIDDLFDDILSDPKNKKRKLYEQVLTGVVDQAKGLNADYILSRIDDFTQRQNFIASILEAGERFQRGDAEAFSEAKTIVSNSLKYKPTSTEKGLYLGDKRNVKFLKASAQCDYSLGIKEFDRYGMGLTFGEATGFEAAKGRGKTWTCVNVGTQVMMQGGRPLHISLEMKDQRVIPRYLRRLFAIAKRNEKYGQTVFKLDELDRVVGFDRRSTKAKMSLADPDIEAKVAKKMSQFGTRLNRLHFKAFPTSQLTMSGLNAYIDSLEATDGFIPTALILDYPKLMHYKGADFRIELGRRVEELRGLLVERNMAGFFPFQTHRAGEDATHITAKHIGEDYSMTQTVDINITYSQTKQEKALGLARLLAEKSREDKDGFEVLITQDYETGQFVKQSAFLPNEYWRMVKGEDAEEDSDE